MNRGFSLARALVPALAIVVGGGLTAASAGTIDAWGSNGSEQLNVPGDDSFIVIVGGELHSLALWADGSLTAWGQNTYGQTDVPAGHEFVAIDPGEKYRVALRSDGTLIAWGDDSLGQLDVPAGSGFTAIAAGREHGLALVPEPSALGLLMLGAIALRRRSARG
jgi:hypothetical protein